MADIPGQDDSTSGPLAWLLAVLVILLVLALPTVVVTAFLFTFFIVLDSVLGLPTVTIGVLESVGVPSNWVLPLLLSVGLGVLVSLGLVAQNGFDWEGTDSDGSIFGTGPFR